MIESLKYFFTVNTRLININHMNRLLENVRMKVYKNRDICFPNAPRMQFLGF